MKGTNRVSLDQLRHLVELATELNFTRAAANCNIAQPPFSRSIQQLEAAVGIQLIDRSKRSNIQLTAAGRLLARDAEILLDQLGIAIARARKHAAPQARLRVGFIEYAYTVLGRDFLDRFHRQRADIAVEPKDLVPNLIEQALTSGQVDCQFLALPEHHHFPRQSALEDWTVKAEPLAAMVSKQHPLARRRTLGLAELVNYPLVLFGRSRAPGVFDMIVHRFRESHLRPKIDEGVLFGQTMVNAVRASQAVGIVPLSLKAAMVDTKVIPIAPDEPLTIRLALVWSKRNRPESLNAFLDYVKRVNAAGPRDRGRRLAP
jgi:DNA-binding transcriptional LysR family regulator